MDAPLLFPAPRELELYEEVPGPARDVRPETRRLRALPAQGFELVLDSRGAQIRYADPAGRRYAEAALAGLRRRGGSRLPALRVRDWPDFPVRGVMLDVSRDRVPTRSTLERIVDLLALFRLNQLQLYTEHAFAYRDHATVWREASPITAEDVHWLDGLCRERGIELVPNQNCFGHMGRWLRHARYRHRAEQPEGFDVPGLGRRPAGVLAPTPENARFALALVRELTGHFTSRRVNIGCDETFELGEGVSRAEVARRGRGRVYLDHLLRLLDPLRAEGHEVLFWGDVVQQHPELARELPPDDSVALAWYYEAPMDPAATPAPSRALLDRLGFGGEKLRGFASQLGPFEANGLAYWVCPGTSTWNSLVGRLDNARGNLLDAAETGLAAGARGYLITDWGDNGHLQPPSLSFAPLAYGAAVSWGVERNRELDVAPLLDALVFEDAVGELGGVIQTVGTLHRGTGRFGINGSPLFGGLLDASPLHSLGQTDEEGTRAVIAALEDARDRLDRARPRCVDAEVVRRELAQAIRLARHGAWRLLRAAGLACPSDAALRRDLAEAIAGQRACWLERSRPGGLRDSLARLEGVLEEYAP
jgi:hexosaminidase